MARSLRWTMPCCATTLALAGAGLCAEARGEGSPKDFARSQEVLLDVARSPSGAGLVAVLRRPAAAKGLEVGALLLGGPDDTAGRLFALGSPGPCLAAGVGMADEAAVVGCIRAGELRAQGVGSRADAATVLEKSDRPQDSSRAKAAGANADVLVSWTSEDGTAAHRFLR